MRRYLLVALGLALIPAAAGIVVVVNDAPQAAAVDTGTLGGTVYWDGAPVTGVGVGTYSRLEVRTTAGPMVGAETSVDPATGLYIWSADEGDGLAPGNYTIEVTKGDLLLTTFTALVSLNTIAVRDVDLTPSVGRVTGQVHSGGAPLANANLQGDFNYQGGPDGNFVMFFPPGPRTVHVYTPFPAHTFVGSCSFTVVQSVSTSTSACEFTSGPAPTPTLTPGYPDIRIGNVSIGYQTSGCYFPGNAFGLRVTVMNSGDTGAGSFVVDANGYEQTVPGLAAGAQIQMLFPNYVYMGTNTVTVDSTNVITESNESNNTFSAFVPVPTQPLPCTPTATPTPPSTPTLPDLRIGDVTIGYETPGCFFQGNRFGLRVNVFNDGAAPAGTFVVNGNGAEQSVPGMNAGAGAMVFFPGGHSMGNQVITVDSTNVIIESNEFNNTFDAPVPIPTQPVPCTPTATATPTLIPPPPITPTPDACPGSQNSDGNLIDLSTLKGYNDSTVANSDTLCDDVDTDDDNDGISDADELTGAACDGIITNPLLADTDGDRALDAAECALGTDPTDPNDSSTAAQCIAATSSGDEDGDGVPSWREHCYYNTAPNNPNTDGDTKTNVQPLNDGCEVYSINADQVVNIVDLQQIASEIGHYGPPPPDYPNHATYRLKVNFDVTKDGTINVVDLQQTARAIAICA